VKRLRVGQAAVVIAWWLAPDGNNRCHPMRGSAISVKTLHRAANSVAGAM
jgi:hypothetical protein